MGDEELIELIAARVKARLMAGGAGAGYTRPASTPTPTPRPAAYGGQELEDCDDCGMCEVGAKAIVDMGAVRIGSKMGVSDVPGNLAQYIDHTLLKPEATREQLKALAEEARKYKFATVCVNSVNVRLMTQYLKGSGVPVCAVVGFPLGAMNPRSKAYETKEAIRCGAGEIDMVLNIGALKSGDYALVLQDIKAVVEAAAPIGVKVILETSKLTHDEKVMGCVLSKAAGAAFVKTSTGFGGGGATAEDVALMRSIVGSEMGVKASGGVRSKEDAHAMLSAGANRLGASASVAIVTGARGGQGY